MSAPPVLVSDISSWVASPQCSTKILHSPSHLIFTYIFSVLVFQSPTSFSFFPSLYSTFLCSFCLPALQVVVLPWSSSGPWLTAFLLFVSCIYLLINHIFYFPSFFLLLPLCSCRCFCLSPSPAPVSIFSPGTWASQPAGDSGDVRHAKEPFTVQALPALSPHTSKLWIRTSVHFLWWQLWSMHLNMWKGAAKQANLRRREQCRRSLLLSRRAWTQGRTTLYEGVALSRPLPQLPQTPLLNSMWKPPSRQRWPTPLRWPRPTSLC